MDCNLCGIPNERGAAFCRKCGTALVPNHLGWAIMVTIACCLPSGIVAIVYAAQVNMALKYGDYDKAVQLANNARNWCLASYGLFIALLAGLFIAQFMSTRGVSVWPF